MRISFLWRSRIGLREAPRSFHVFFFNDTATTEIYPLSLHDALPIYNSAAWSNGPAGRGFVMPDTEGKLADRKSTRLNSSHANISYAVFCLKKKRRGFGSLAGAERAIPGSPRGSLLRAHSVEVVDPQA